MSGGLSCRVGRLVIFCALALTWALPSSADNLLWDGGIGNTKVSKNNLEQELNDRAVQWLRAMDLFIERRSSQYNEELIAFMDGLFAPVFYYETKSSAGNELFPKARLYTVREWVEGQDIDSAAELKGTMIAPPHPHFMTVVKLGKQVKLEGYHDHIWTGDFVLGLRTTREIGFDEFTFEKIGGQWLVTRYVETVSEVSPCSELGKPSPCAPQPLSPAAGHPPNFSLLKDELH
jgi:hypothetical protein